MRFIIFLSLLLSTVCVSSQSFTYFYTYMGWKGNFPTLIIDNKNDPQFVMIQPNDRSWPLVVRNFTDMTVQQNISQDNTTLEGYRLSADSLWLITTEYNWTDRIRQVGIWRRVNS